MGKTKRNSTTPGPRVRISFRKSSSYNFEKAISLAKSLKSYKLTGKDSLQEHSIDEPLLLSDLKAWKTLRELARVVRGWRTSEVQFKNFEDSQHFFHVEMAMDEIESCFAGRKDASDKDGYCLGKSSPSSDKQFFGCRHESGVGIRATRPWGYRKKKVAWFKFGKLSPDNREFRVDRTAVLKELKTKSSQNLCAGCPALDWKRFEKSVAALPANIPIAGSEYKLTYSGIDKKPIGIEPKHGDDPLGLTIRIGGSDADEAENESRKVPNVRYSDIAGQSKAIEAIKDVVQLPLTHEAYFREAGVESHRGILLYGPPGNGKTLLAKAVATESNAHLEIINGPEILSKWVGASEENLRNIFERAKKYAPSIILIDEIDAIAGSRAKMTHQHDVSLISQLLVLLDGIEERGRICVIGTTNRPEEVDAAIRRPGRLDYAIPVAMPDAAARAAILRVHSKKMKLDGDIGFSALAKQTEGYSGADLAALAREAGITAIKVAIAKGKSPNSVRITAQDFRVAASTIAEKRIKSEG